VRDGGDLVLQGGQLRVGGRQLGGGFGGGGLLLGEGLPGVVEVLGEDLQLVATVGGQLGRLLTGRGLTWGGTGPDGGQGDACGGEHCEECERGGVPAGSPAGPVGVQRRHGAVLLSSVAAYRVS